MLTVCRSTHVSVDSASSSRMVSTTSRFTVTSTLHPQPHPYDRSVPAPPWSCCRESRIPAIPGSARCVRTTRPIAAAAPSAPPSTPPTSPLPAGVASHNTPHPAETPAGAAQTPSSRRIDLPASARASGPSRSICDNFAAVPQKCGSGAASVPSDSAPRCG